MNKLSALANKGKSLAFIVFNIIDDIILDFIQKPISSLIGIWVTKSVVESIIKMNNLIREKSREFNFFSLYANIEDFFENHKAKNTGTSTEYGIILMPKEKKNTRYQSFGMNTSAIALVFSIASLFSLRFKNHTKSSFFNRCRMFLSSSIMFISILLQEWLLRPTSFIFFSASKRDKQYYPKSDVSVCYTCSKVLAFNSFLYLIITHRPNSILGTSIFIVFANLYLSLYRFMSHLYYAYMCIYDNNIRFIALGTNAKVYDGSSPEGKTAQMSEIHITGTFKDWVSEFEKRLSIFKKLLEPGNIKFKTANESVKQKIEEKARAEIKVLDYAVKYLEYVKKANHSSDICDSTNIRFIIRKSNASPCPLIYKTTLSGEAGIAIRKTEGAEESVCPIKFKNAGPARISKQYVGFFYTDSNLQQALDDIGLATIGPDMQGYRTSMLLTEFVATLIATNMEYPDTEYPDTEYPDQHCIEDLRDALKNKEPKFEISLNKVCDNSAIHTNKYS